MNPVGTSAELAILRFHQQEFEVIWGSQVLRNPCLTHRLFPEEVALLSAQPIPVLLVIIDNRADEVAFELLQRHCPSLCCFVRIMDPKTGVGQTPFKTLSHPTKEPLDRAFCAWAKRGRLLGEMPRPADQPW